MVKVDLIIAYFRFGIPYMRFGLLLSVKTDGEVKVRSCRRELEEKHHVFTESGIHQVSFDYFITLFIVFIVVSDGDNSNVCVMIDRLKWFGAP